MSDTPFPESFTLRMREQLGEHWDAFGAAHRASPPISIRLNPAKLQHPPAGASSIPWTTSGYYLNERPSFTLDPLFHAGAYYVQEASSMFLEQAFRQATDTGKALNVLDLCAAPGGKSTHLLSLMNDESLLVSNEVIRSRATVLAENIQKWGHNNAVVVHNDPQDFQRLPGFFDVMVVDAPCSGEGLFRKDPQAMNEWSPDNVQLCAKRQRRILSDVWPALKTGGLLIYSTCTYNHSENEENLAWLKQERNVEFVPLMLNEQWRIEATAYQGVTGYRFYPHRIKGEGFFLCVVRKTDDEREMRVRHKNSFTGPAKKVTEQLSAWIKDASEKTFIVRHDQIQCFPKSQAANIDFLVKNLYLINAGTVVATVKHEKLIPEHALALSVDLQRENFSRIDVSLQEAWQYLRKETLTIQADKKGYALICYEGTPLGWVNALDNRINNLYPSEWRIRQGS